MFDRITFDPEIMGGRACIRRMRITVSVIVGQIVHGASFEEILEGYPDLEREDIRQVMEYSAWSSASSPFVGGHNQSAQNPNAVSAALAPVPDAITTNCRPSLVR
jgi:uncharacterized protein (DUF433 family)